MGIQFDFQDREQDEEKVSDSGAVARRADGATYSDWSVLWSAGTVEIGRWSFRGRARESLSGMTEIVVVTSGECDVHHDDGETHLSVGDCVVLDESTGAFEISAPTHLVALITVIRGSA